jgi:hypothetical protein
VTALFSYRGALGSGFGAQCGDAFGAAALLTDGDPRWARLARLNCATVLALLHGWPDQERQVFEIMLVLESAMISQ